MVATARGAFSGVMRIVMRISGDVRAGAGGGAGTRSLGGGGIRGEGLGGVSCGLKVRGLVGGRARPPFLQIR